MGGLSSLFYNFRRKRNFRILFLGLDGAGKTTILYQLKHGEFVPPMPTLGFNVETIDRGNFTYTVWDVAMKKDIRVPVKHYYRDKEAFVFVIDCSDHERYNEAVDELRETFTPDAFREIPILVLANKQDLATVMSHTDVRSDLMTKDFLLGRTCEVFPVSGLNGDGLKEGIDWLTAVLTNDIH